MSLDPRLEFGPFSVDPAEQRLLENGVPVAVTPKVFAVLVMLLRHHGRLVDKQDLLTHIWPDSFVEEGTLARHVSDLRKALKDGRGAAHYIETVPKRGYRFIADVRTTPSPPEGAAASRPSPGTVGRDRERLELRAAFQAVKAGRGSLMCVSGEPGIGKTTLVEDFLAEVALHGPCVILRGRCSERLAGTEAYLPFLEALGSLLQGTGMTAVATLMKEKAPTWYAQVAPRSRPGDEHWVADIKFASQERMKRELTDLAHHLAQTTPLVVFFDDLHWADVSTIDLLGFLAGRLDALKLMMMLVVAYRPSDMLLAKHPFLQIKPDLQARGVCREMALPFLSETDIARYLTLEFPAHRFPPDFATVIWMKTEGSPLFMTDLVRYLRDRGTIARTSGDWTLAEALPDLERALPESVRGMIERKIAQLTKEDRTLLVAASVQGYEFDSAVIATVLNLAADVVEDRLEALERVFAFVTLVSEAEFPNGALTVRYRFVHVLYQNALYASVQPTRRAALNAAVARALVLVYGDQTATIAAQLAVLYSAARDFVPAVEHYLLAAQQATRVFAHAEAAALANRGLALLDKLPDNRQRAHLEIRLRSRLVGSLTGVKGHGASEVLLTHLRMCELCEHLSDHVQLLRTQFGLSIVYTVRGEYDRGRQLAQQCLGQAGSSGDSAMTVLSHYALGLSLAYLGDLVEACNQFALVRERFDPARHSAIALYGNVLAPSYLGRSLLYLGHHDRGRRLLQDALAAAENTRHPIGLVNTLCVAAFSELLHRRMPQMLDITDRIVDMAGEHGYPYYRAIGIMLRGVALTQGQGDERGITLIREGLAAHRAAETWQNHATYLILLADALGATGHTDEALATLDEAERTIVRTNERYYEPELYRLKGSLLLKRANHDGPDNAEACFAEAIRTAQRRHLKSLQLRASTDLAALWARQGKRPRAERMLSEIFGWFTEGVDTADVQDAKQLLGELRASSG